MDVSIFCDEIGEGPPLVVLHGWGADSRFMAPVVEHLCDRYCTLSFDLPGRGQSEWSFEMKHIDHVADGIIPFLPESAVFLGWSYGGLVAQSIAIRYPDLVKRMIGVCTTPKFVTEEGWPGIPEPGFTPEFEKAKPEGYLPFITSFIETEFPEDQRSSQQYQTLMQLAQESPKVNMDILVHGVGFCDKADFRKGLPELSMPVDFIFGGKDDTIPREAHAKIKEIAPNTNIHVIDDAKHLPFWTHPKEFFSIIDTILK